MNRWKKEQNKLKNNKVCINDASKRCGQSDLCVMRSSSCPITSDQDDNKETYEIKGDTDPMREYLSYLKRSIRNRKYSIWQVHQFALSRIVAESFGVTKEQIKWLDNNL